MSKLCYGQACNSEITVITLIVHFIRNTCTTVCLKKKILSDQGSLSPCSRCSWCSCLSFLFWMKYPSSTLRTDMLSILRCFSAHHGCKHLFKLLNLLSIGHSPLMSLWTGFILHVLHSTLVKHLYKLWRVVCVKIPGDHPFVKYSI